MATKCIGIVGGMSPESTATYYEHIVHRHVRERGDHAYPRIVIASVSFQRYVDWQHAGEWDRIAEGLQGEFEAVARAGADFAVLATNTMHKVLGQVRSPIPVLSILDAVARAARQAGVGTVGLTGTRFTMSDGFYAEGLERRGLKVVVPEEAEQADVHRIIYDELIQGAVRDASQARFGEVARALTARGAEAVLLGCTELELLVRGRDPGVRVLDGTSIHADAAWEVAVAG